MIQHFCIIILKYFYPSTSYCPLIVVFTLQSSPLTQPEATTLLLLPLHWKHRNRRPTVITVAHPQELYPTFLSLSQPRHATAAFLPSNRHPQLSYFPSAPLDDVNLIMRCCYSWFVKYLFVCCRSIANMGCTMSDKVLTYRHHLLKLFKERREKMRQLQKCTELNYAI